MDWRLEETGEGSGQLLMENAIEKDKNLPNHISIQLRLCSKNFWPNVWGQLYVFFQLFGHSDWRTPGVTYGGGW